MTSLLLLAQELFERATNPAYGVAVNDEQAARLAAAIGPDDIERFAYEVQQLDDPSTLTSYGWAWVLDFAVGHGVAMDRELLADLCQRWDEPALKALVIEAATEVEGDDVPGSNDIAWLEGVIDQAAPPLVDQNDISIGDPRINRVDFEPIDVVDTSSAEALLIALLIVRTDTAIDAARRLVAREWPGAAQLNAFLNAHLEDSDPLGRAAWDVLRG